MLDCCHYKLGLYIHTSANMVCFYPWLSLYSTNEWIASGRFGCNLQVEIQVRKIYCINRAVPTLPINLEDAARSEAEFEKAELVCLMHILWFPLNSVSRKQKHAILCLAFLPMNFRFILKFLKLTLCMIEGWRKACSCWSRYSLELQSYWSTNTLESSCIPDPVSSWKRECHTVLLLICYYSCMYHAASDSMLYDLCFRL